MSDSAFKIILTLLFWLLSALVIAGIALGAMGMPWLNADLPALIFLTVLIGLIVLIAGGAALIYIWGKRYMAKG
jgi:hypothetical protein